MNERWLVLRLPRFNVKVRDGEQRLYPPSRGSIIWHGWVNNMQYKAAGSSWVGIYEDCSCAPRSTERFEEAGLSDDMKEIEVALEVRILC